jgi:hypothetical protein
VLWRVSIRYRPLIGPVQAWCYQSRDGALNRGGDSNEGRAQTHGLCGNEGCELIDDDILGELVLLVPLVPLEHLQWTSRNDCWAGSPATPCVA